jgi:hypothetical protein
MFDLGLLLTNRRLQSSPNFLKRSANSGQKICYDMVFRRAQQNNDALMSLMSEISKGNNAARPAHCDDGPRIEQRS